MSEYNVTRTEKILSSVASGNPSGIEPITREEMFLSYIAGESDTKPKPITRKEKLLDKIGASGDGGGAKPEQEKTVEITENGTTDVLPDDGYALSKVTVNTSVIDGDPGKPYIDTSAITDFSYFFKENRRSYLLDQVDTSNGVKFKEAFRQAKALKTTEGFDFSKCDDMNSAFLDCTELVFAHQFDTSKCKSMPSIFSGCTKLESAPALDLTMSTSNGGLFQNCEVLKNAVVMNAKADFTTMTFYNCYALETVTISANWRVSIYLNYSNNLTVESLHGMIENLADLTGLTAKNFKVGETNLAKIDEDHIAMLNAKNWNYS